MRKGRLRFIFPVFALLILFPGGSSGGRTGVEWSRDEVDMIRSLWIGSLPPIPSDPSNKFSSNRIAAAFGKKLFFDTRFSGNRKVSCGSCHVPEYNFTDRLPVAHGMGTGSRRTMPLIGVAYNDWFFWDGRKDSLWSQALGPIESPLEHGFSRTRSVLVVLKHYRREYEEVFGPLPSIDRKDLEGGAKPGHEDPSALKKWVLLSQGTRNSVNRVYVNLGKSIEAYVRTIVPGPSSFDRYAEALIRGDREGMEKAMSRKAALGLKLFIGKAQCVNCHNGPLFTNGDFHNVGVERIRGKSVDRGRAGGISAVLSDEFNCLSDFSDAKPGECTQIRYIETDREKYEGAFKTPTLRNVADRSPYMHKGEFSTLLDVLEFYRKSKNPALHHGDLSERELHELEAFLKSLSGSVRSL